jgi:hypothetical protein
MCSPNNPCKVNRCRARSRLFRLTFETKLNQRKYSLKMSDLEDKTLNCCDCHRDFVFRAKDQEFFARMNFSDPRRCKPCRDIKKAQKEGVAAPAQGVAQSFPEDDFGTKKKSSGGGGRRRRDDE